MTTFFGFTRRRSSSSIFSTPTAAAVVACSSFISGLRAAMAVRVA